MEINLNRYVILVFTIAFLGACAPMPSIDKSAAVEERKGYVFGSFKLHDFWSDCDLRLGLALRRSGGTKEYVIEFSKSEPVSVFAVQPGRYEVAQIVFKGCDGMEMGKRKGFRAILVNGEIDVPAKGAVYVGNYVGIATQVVENKIVKMNWEVTAACRAFSETTSRMVKSWPKLSDVPKIDATTVGRLCEESASAK